MSSSTATISVSVVPIVPVPATPPIPTIIPIISVSSVVIPPTRTQTPAPAPADPVPAVPPEQLPPQFPPGQFHVHEITISSPVAVVFLELAARGFTEVGDGGEVGDNGAAVVKAALQGLQGGGSLVLLLKLDIDITDHMVREIVANVEALDLAELVKFFEDVLVEILEVFLDLAGVDGLTLGIHAWGDHVGPLVHVGQ